MRLSASSCRPWTRRPIGLIPSLDEVRKRCAKEVGFSWVPKFVDREGGTNLDANEF